LGSKGTKAVPAATALRAPEFVKQALPSPGVQTCGVGQHAVHVKKGSAVVALRERDSCPLPHRPSLLVEHTATMHESPSQASRIAPRRGSRTRARSEVTSENGKNSLSAIVTSLLPAKDGSWRDTPWPRLQSQGRLDDLSFVSLVADNEAELTAQPQHGLVLAQDVAEISRTRRLRAWSMMRVMRA
jgi:hypothetical protein